MRLRWAPAQSFSQGEQIELQGRLPSEADSLLCYTQRAGVDELLSCRERGRSTSNYTEGVVTDAVTPVPGIKR